MARKPIPLDFIHITQEEKSVFNQAFSQAQPGDANKSFSITFNVPPRYGGSFSLTALTHSDRVSWVDAIEKQKALIVEHKKRFEVSTLAINFFMKSNPVNCSCSHTKYLFLGTDSGLYVGGYAENLTGSTENLAFTKFVKVLDLEKLYQVDVIPKIDTLLVLQGIQFQSLRSRQDPPFLSTSCYHR